MVLLTSSTVSAIISAGIISAFTFLLFLAGYVLQQQSVNSLREAIRQPPPPPPPQATLPPQFQDVQHDSEQVVTADGNASLQGEPILQVLASPETDAPRTIAVSTSSKDSLAYVVGLAAPSDLCSAALLAKTLDLSLEAPTRLVVLYPSSWETHISPLHMSALTFMRNLQTSHPIIYHPVEFVKGWESASTHAHLLGELQRTRWEFDRMLYLKTPGMLVGKQEVEAALRKDAPGSARLWTPVSKAAGEDPDVLLWHRRKGLLMPRGEMRTLAGTERIKAPRLPESVTEEELPLGRGVSYLLFDQAVDHTTGKSEELLQFEDGLLQVCKGQGLLQGEQDRVDLRRI